ncbi:MAG: DUF5684 domain-containing protein, partial [Phycisphaerae bacterium]
MIKFSCSRCGQSFTVSEEYAGKKAACPKCKNPVLVPSVSQTEKVKQPQLIKFHCPHCSQKIGLALKYSGKTVRCAKCKQPLKVPLASAPTIPVHPKPTITQPKPKDQTEILRAGQEHNTQSDPWNDMESLKFAEESGDAVGVPQKSNSVDGVDELAEYDRAMRGGDFYQDTIKSDRWKSRTGLLIGLGSTAAVLVAAVMLGLSVFSFFRGITKGQVKSPQAQEFVERFIYLAADKKNEEAKSYFTQEVQADIDYSHIERFAAVIARSEIVQMECTYIRAVEDEHGRKLFVWYEIYFMNPDEMKTFEDFSKTAEVFALVLENESGFKLGSISTLNTQGDTVDIGKSSYDNTGEMFASIVTDMTGSINWPVFVVAILIVIVVGIIQSISVYIIFDKAGEPGWAIFVPFYNMWVWAVVGNRPGWVGLSTFLTSFIPLPYVGDLLWLAIWIYITTGVAKAFGKGTGFGMGLCFLPIIFYPILA